MKELQEANELLVSLYPDHTVFVEARYIKYSHNDVPSVDYHCSIMKEYLVVAQLIGKNLKELVDNIIIEMSHAGDKGE